MKLFELQSTVIKWVISIFVLPDVPTKCEKRPFPSKKFVKLKWFMGYSARIKCFDYFGNKLDDLTGKWGKSNFYNSNIFPWNYFGYVVKSKQTLPFDGKIQLLEFYFFFVKLLWILSIWRILKIRFRQNIRQIEVISALLS